MRNDYEQHIYLHQFQAPEPVQRTIDQFITRYDTQWLIERLGHRTPAQVRAEAQSPQTA